jgi:hypothetical protein
LQCSIAVGQTLKIDTFKPIPVDTNSLARIRCQAGPSSRNHEILPIYVLQGNFGFIYKTNLGGLLHPELILDVNEKTFIALLKKKYGIEVGYRIS